MKTFSIAHWRRHSAVLASITVISLLAQPALLWAAVSTSGNAPPLGPDSTTSETSIGVGIKGTGTLTVNGGSTLALPTPATGLTLGGASPDSGHGSVLIDGSGSRIDAAATGGFVNVGRFGNTSVGDLTITNGGVLETTFFNTGRDGATGNVLIDGTGSALRLHGQDAAGNSAGGTLGRDNGIASVTVRNNATLTIESPSATLTSPGFSLGRVISTPNSAAQGSLTIETGGALTITGNALGGGLNVGRDAGTTGAVTVRSGGSIRVNSNPAGGGFTIGDSGTGTFLVDGGGVLLDGQSPTATPGITLGSVEGSSGTLSLVNGSSLTINRPSASCCMTVGRLGQGAISITGGSKLVLNDTSSQQGGGIAFGGNGTSTAGGQFSALVSGAGSELTINSRGGGMSVGYQSGGTGTFTLSDGATFNGHVIRVGRLAGSTAIVNVAGTGTRANLVGDPSTTNTRGLVVGEEGNAQASVTGGAVVQIHAPAANALAGLQVGGSGAGSGGRGAIVVAGAGTKIETTGIGGALSVGFDPSLSKPSTGTVTVASGGSIVLDPAVYGAIGRTAGSSGTLTVIGAGSMVDTGSLLAIGLGPDDSRGGTGTVIVSADATVKAGEIHIGPGGTLGGNSGTVIGKVSNKGGAVSPGPAPGRLTISGDYESLGGTLRIEVGPDGSYDSLATTGVASFDPSSRVEVRIDPAFRPAAGATLDVVRGRATTGAPVTALLQVQIAPGGGAATVQGPLSTLPTVIAVEPVPAPATLVAAVLPSSRSVVVGSPATAFMTIINAGTVPAENVVVSPAAPIAATFAFQPMDPGTGPKGAAGVPVRIEPGLAETFLIVVAPTAPLLPTEVALTVAGTNTAPFTSLPGINTLLLSASPTPVPDVVAIAATANNDGIVDVPGAGGTGAFAVATVNVGAGGLITASPTFGEGPVAATLFICETDPATALCKDALAPSTTVQIDANQTPTFSIFVQGAGPIDFDPALNRVVVEFHDATGTVRGRTSVAVRTQ